MIVYLVVADLCCFDGGLDDAPTVDSVWSTRALANKRLRRLRGPWYVVEWRVDTIGIA